LWANVAFPHVAQREGITRLLFNKRNLARARSSGFFSVVWKQGMRGTGRSRKVRPATKNGIDRHLAHSPMHLFSCAALPASHIAVTSSCGADQACVMRSLFFCWCEANVHAMRCDAHRERCCCALSYSYRSLAVNSCVYFRLVKCSQHRHDFL
jgi:hypothetical protein